MTAKAKTFGTSGRIDVVFIRKSSAKQDESGQMNNVRAMLKARGQFIPDGNWFVGCVGRRKVKANAEFNRLMELVEADRVGTVYIESQDRWGTGDRPELFNLLGTLRDHHTRLFDLRDGKDLTEKDFATELLAFVGSIKSEKELQDIAYRSLRTRVNNFKDTGSWPTGTHPYGYGKECRTTDGRLLWVFQPINRSTGQLFYPDESGTLKPGPDNVNIPRKAKGEIIKLVPSSHPEFVRAVQLIFDLYTRVGLSRRAISARLNDEGLTFNGGNFTHPDVTHILQNPAYQGDTVFGKVQTGELSTFDEQGLIVPVKGKREDIRRDVSECIVRRDTHEPLVDRPTWELAANKLAAERERTCFSPRNPDYWLRPLFVCGHCGKNMSARTEKNPDTGARKVVYLCSSYSQAQSGGYAATCGYQRISHEDAERLLLDKIAELNLPFDETASEGARANLKARFERLGIEDDDSQEQWKGWIESGLAALVEYLRTHYDVQPATLTRLEKTARCLYGLGWLTRGQIAGLPATPEAPLPTPAQANRTLLTPEHHAALANFKQIMKEAEAEAVEMATRKVAELETEHAAYTRMWVKATSELQQAVLKTDMDRLEAEIGVWKPKTVPLSERLKSLAEADKARRAEFDRIRAEWPTLENREKGEAMRRLFNTVTLFWEAKQNQPVKARPSRPRKTGRRGRKSYTLLRSRIRWSLATTDLETSS